MKIYKIHLDPTNPIEQHIRIDAGSDFGLEITWDYSKYPTIPGTDIDSNSASVMLIEQNAFKKTISTGNTKINPQFILNGAFEVSSANGKKVAVAQGTINKFSTTKKYYMIFGKGGRTADIRECFQTKVSVSFVENDIFSKNISPYGPLIKQDGTLPSLIFDVYCFKIQGTYMEDYGQVSYFDMDYLGNIDICTTKNSVLNLYGGSVEVSANNNIKLNGNSIAIGSSSDPATVTINGTNICDIGGSSYDSINETPYVDSCGYEYTQLNLDSPFININSDNIITMTGNRVNINGGVYINGQEYQPGGGSSYETICEYDYCGRPAVSIAGSETIIGNSSDTMYLALYGNCLHLNSTTFSINGTQICLTKFLADYGM